MMRSVDKGLVPLDEGGQTVLFARYQDAAAPLKIRLGRYCSFCERTVPVSLAVEHKLPKESHPLLELDWTNFLLGCANCNSSKSTKQFGGIEPMWPDEHDTCGLIEYRRSGAVDARAGVPAADRLRVRALLAMVGLDKTPANSPPTDHRFDDRLEVWSQAEQSAADLAEADSPMLRRAIVRTAASKGGYSIWMHVFRTDQDMVRRLVEAFPGTRQQQ